MNPPLFPYLVEHGRAAVAQIAALSAFDEERAENLRVLRQVVERQRGCLTAGDLCKNPPPPNSRSPNPGFRLFFVPNLPFFLPGYLIIRHPDRLLGANRHT